MENRKELKTCPFCGGAGQMYEPDYPAVIGKRYAIICTNCGTSTHTIYQNKTRAIEAWNRREENM